MTGRVFIEAAYATFGGIPTPARHLYLVYEAENGIEYTMRGGPETTFGLFGGSFEILDNVRLSNSPDSRDISERAERDSTELDFAGMTDDQAWALMLKYARSFEATDPDYNVLTSNSNSFIGAMLAATGADPYTMLPDGVSSGAAVGFGDFDDILNDLAPPTDWRTVGSSGADRIVGEAHDEEIVVAGGRDIVHARAGSDLILGQGGRDLLHGQAGSDVLHGGRGGDRLWGEGDSDRLEGGGAADRLFGGSGDDVLIGGRGNDLLSGGNGADVFVFDTRNSNHIDTVTDFVSAVDEVHLQASAFAHLVGDIDGYLTGAQFHSGTTAEDAEDRIIYTLATGELWYDRDGTGSGAQTLIGWLDADLDLSARDFAVI